MKLTNHKIFELNCQGMIESFDRLNLPVFITDQINKDGKTHFIYANDAFCKMTGHACEGLEQKTPNVLLGQETSDKTLQKMSDQLKNQQSFNEEMVLYTADGKTFNVTWQIQPLLDTQANLVGYLSFLSPEFLNSRVGNPLLKSSEDATDELTQLYNSQKFEEIIHYHLSESSSEELRKISLICIDIVNDQSTETLSDSTIKALAQTLKNNVRNQDILCRWNDKAFFAIVQSEVQQAYLVAENLKRALIKETQMEHPYLSYSLGVTNLTTQDSNETLFSRANKALFQAHNSGKNRIFSIQA